MTAGENAAWQSVAAWPQSLAVEKRLERETHAHAFDFSIIATEPALSAKAFFNSVETLSDWVVKLFCPNHFAILVLCLRRIGLREKATS
jgi:hypothetical protein